jgi:hypothetical protein
VYVYHVTPAIFLLAIKREGLRPRWHEHAQEEVIFVEPEREQAEIYAEPGTVTLRIDLGSDGAVGNTEDGEDVLYETVPPERLSVFHRNAWRALKRMKFRR